MQQAEQCLQQDGFTRAVRPDNCNVTTRIHGETEVMDDTAIVDLNTQRLHRKNDARRQFASILFSVAVGNCA